jgi:hypothetical protein
MEFKLGGYREQTVLWGFRSFLILMWFIMASVRCDEFILKRTFTHHIEMAALSFHQRSLSRARIRYLCAGVVGAVFMLTIVRNAFPSINRVQLAREYAKVHHLHEYLKKGPTESPGVLYMLLKDMWDLTKECIVWFVREGVLGNIAYGLALSFFEPIQSYFTVYSSVPSQDSWFLREQVLHSHMVMVLVSHDLYDFVEELKAFEIEITILKKLVAQSEVVPAHDILEPSCQRVYQRVVRILGHVVYLKESAVAPEKVLIQLIQEPLERAIWAALSTWNQAFEKPESCIELEQATTYFEETIKNELRILSTISHYRVHPWPPSVACSEYIRLLLTRPVIQYGNPIA